MEGAFIPNCAYKQNWGQTVTPSLVFSDPYRSQTSAPFQGCGEYRKSTKTEHTVLSWLCAGAQASLAAELPVCGVDADTVSQPYK